MICIQKGDLLNIRENRCHFILHQANCEKTMGKGLALKIAKLFPLAEKVDSEFPYELEDRLGKYSIAKINSNLYVVNLYAQLYRGKPQTPKELKERYRYLRQSLNAFLGDLNKKQKIEGRSYKVGIPYKLGSDLAGASWERVLEILIDVSERQAIDLYVYKFS